MSTQATRSQGSSGAAHNADEGTAIARKRASDGKRAERKLGLMLVAPAVIVMLAVTAYPIVYALWLSLQRADLRQPDKNQFVGLENYITVLSSPIWWNAFGITVFYTIFGARALRDRHRGGRVLLALRVDGEPRISRRE